MLCVFRYLKHVFSLLVLDNLSNLFYKNNFIAINSFQYDVQHFKHYYNWKYNSKSNGLGTNYL